MKKSLCYAIIDSNYDAIETEEWNGIKQEAMPCHCAKLLSRYAKFTRFVAKFTLNFILILKTTFIAKFVFKLIVHV